MSLGLYTVDDVKVGSVLYDKDLNMYFDFILCGKILFNKLNPNEFWEYVNMLSLMVGSV